MVFRTQWIIMAETRVSIWSLFRTPTIWMKRKSLMQLLWGCKTWGVAKEKRVDTALWILLFFRALMWSSFATFVSPCQHCTGRVSSAVNVYNLISNSIFTSVHWLGCSYCRFSYHFSKYIYMLILSFRLQEGRDSIFMVKFIITENNSTWQYSMRRSIVAPNCASKVTFCACLKISY